METRNAEIITVGEEYTRRDTAGTGADVIAALLDKVGVAQKSRYYVGEDEEEICASIGESMARYELTFITGNFADFPIIAAKTVARVLGVGTVSDAGLFSCMKSYAKKHDSSLSDSAEAYAVVPEGAKILVNENVPIPGYVCKKGDKTLIVLPGSPDYISLICDECLVDCFKEYNDKRAEKQFDLIGCKMRDILAVAHELEEKYPDVSITLFRPTAEFALSVSARDAGLVDRVAGEIIGGPLGEYVYGINTDLQTEVVRRLTEKGQTVATAESCTGGLVAKLITDVPGSSKVFPGGVVSYSNDIKMSFLGVDEEVLREYGAVSHRVAIKMAEGVRHRMGADWGIGITGVAGPGGGTPEKPVGLVYVAIASKVRSRVLKFNIDGNRDMVRNTVAKYALRELLIRMRNRDKRKEKNEEE